MSKSTSRTEFFYISHQWISFFLILLCFLNSFRDYIEKSIETVMHISCKLHSLPVFISNSALLSYFFQKFSWKNTICKEFIGSAWKKKNLNFFLMYTKNWNTWVIQIKIMFFNLFLRGNHLRCCCNEKHPSENNNDFIFKINALIIINI